jgi:hypothetical protein
MKEKMKGMSLRLTLAALAGLAVMVAAFIKGELAQATPALNFNSEILSKVFFESIDIGGHPRHDHHRPHANHRGPGHGPGHDDDDDDDDDANPFRVKIKVKDPADVYVVRNKVPPGGYSGWHTHPGPSVVSVTAGVATVYDGDDPSCTPNIYPAGTGFIDAGGDHTHMVRNEGTVDLETVAFQVVPVGASRRIDAPAPGVCPF